ncbi:hypothetical protein [Leptospira kmetyi]|uniref:Uncharacterized protein n=2 Tax=Leptospira kmetyi TaxID=408139 RepID=A0AAD0UNU0_9LEPT|nr:hypothetical protein [Leptospira kmetyi]AYV55174.1 hypothetical protein EFP84_06385 [Leptospira kmetyi]PJZ30224.1 hypothetical protein CH378_08300 [Leptospira kmetyi]
MKPFSFSQTSISIRFLFSMILLFGNCGGASGAGDFSSALIFLLGGGDKSVPTGGSHSPVETSNGPVLNNLNVTTEYRVISGDPYQIVSVKFSLKNQVSFPVTYKAYLGRPAILQLKPDGVSVTTYITEKLSTEPGSPDTFVFLSPEVSQSYKIIVIAQSQFGNSSKEIISTAPTPPAGVCAGAVSAPVTIGDCSDHCIQVSMNGTNMEFFSRYVNPEPAYYVYLDLNNGTATGGTGPVPFQYIELYEDAGNPVAPGTYETPKVGFDTGTYNEACIAISSYAVADRASGFSDSYTVKKIIVP